jgi:hypothetical protein
MVRRTVRLAASTVVTRAVRVVMPELLKCSFHESPEKREGRFEWSMAAWKEEKNVTSTPLRAKPSTVHGTSMPGASDLNVWGEQEGSTRFGDGKSALAMAEAGGREKVRARVLGDEVLTT